MRKERQNTSISSKTKEKKKRFFFFIIKKKYQNPKFDWTQKYEKEKKWSSGWPVGISPTISSSVAPPRHQLVFSPFNYFLFLLPLSLSALLRLSLFFPFLYSHFSILTHHCSSPNIPFSLLLLLLNLISTAESFLLLCFLFVFIYWVCFSSVFLLVATRGFLSSTKFLVTTDSSAPRIQSLSFLCLSSLTDFSDCFLDLTCYNCPLHHQLHQVLSFF